MAKRFKLRLSLSRFQICRSNDAISQPRRALPAAASYLFSPVNSKAFDIPFPNFPDPPHSTPNHPSIHSRHSFHDGDNDDDEAETLISSSSSFDSCHERRFCGYGRTENSPEIRRPKCNVSKPESVSPAMTSVSRRMMPRAVEGKAKDSFAVVKRSEDPREDFRRSMVEMILGKQILEEEELEQLLHCFLSLNSRIHHPAILQAFSEIWEVLFSNIGGHDS